METIHQFGQRCVAALRLHEDSAAFIVPVNPEEVPDYYDVIKVNLSWASHWIGEGEWVTESPDALLDCLRRLLGTHLQKKFDRNCFQLPVNPEGSPDY